MSRPSAACRCCASTSSATRVATAGAPTAATASTGQPATRATDVVRGSEDELVAVTLAASGSRTLAADDELEDGYIVVLP